MILNADIDNTIAYMAYSLSCDLYDAEKMSYTEWFLWINGDEYKFKEWFSKNWWNPEWDEKECECEDEL